MNRKQLTFIILGIWSIISWILTFTDTDAQIQYVAGQFGMGLVIVGFCIGFYLFLMIVASGIAKIWQKLGDD